MSSNVKTLSGSHKIYVFTSRTSEDDINYNAQSDVSVETFREWTYVQKGQPQNKILL